VIWRSLAVAFLYGLVFLPALAGASLEAARLPAPVYRTVAVAAASRIYVLGGHDRAGRTVSDVDVFDPVGGVSRRAGSLALPTHGAAAANLGGRILVFGGASSSVHDVVQQFVPASGRALVVGHMPMVRADVTAAVVGRRVILVGGFDGVGPQGEVWATGDGRSFRVVARLPQPVRYPAVAALGSAVYVFGGLISGGEYTGRFSSAIQRVYLPSGTARVVGRPPTPLAHAMAAVVAGRIFVLGGSAPGGPSDAVRRFVPATGRIVLAGRLPHPLTDAAVATIGRTVYLLGGISSGPVATITAVRPR
jgi:serine/threonine-protein kinase PknK